MALKNPTQTLPARKVLPATLISPVQTINKVVSNTRLPSLVKGQTYQAIHPSADVKFVPQTEIVEVAPGFDQLIDGSGMEPLPPVEHVYVEEVSAGPLGLSTTTWLLIGGALVGGYLLLKK